MAQNNAIITNGKKLGEKPLPKWITKPLSSMGISRLNTIRCRYYAMWKVDTKRRLWYSGMFLSPFHEHWQITSFKPEYIVDLLKKTYWKVIKDREIENVVEGGLS